MSQSSDRAWHRSSARPQPAAWNLRAKSNYLEALVMALEPPGGQSWPDRVRSSMRPRLRKLSNLPRNDPGPAVEQALRNGRNTELLLSLPLDNEPLIPASNHWAPVQAYYSVQSVSLAWLRHGDSRAAPNHASQLRSLSDLCSNGTTIPYPFNMTCTRLRPDERVEAHGDVVSRVPGFVPSQRPSPPDVRAYLASALVSTRVDQDEARRRRWLQENPRRERRSPKDVRAHDDAIPPTTFFNFLYEMRLDANYGDSELFTSDGIGWDDPIRFSRGLVVVVGALNLLFENLLAARMGTGVLGDVLDTITGPHTSADRGPFARRSQWFEA